jgi:hypothetical protein
MSLLMVALASKLRPFREVGGSNSEIRSDGKLGDNKDPEKESRKEPKKEQSSSSTINPSQYLFNMEEKVDINPYQGEIDALKLNHWLQQLEVYFNIHHIDEEQKISFSRLKLEGHALTWWEIHTKTLRLEGDPPVTRWEDFKTLIKSQFYPIGYVEDQWIQVALLQEEARAECTGVHHRVQKDGHHVGYLSQEPRCTPQVSGGST